MQAQGQGGMVGEPGGQPGGEQPLDFGAPPLGGNESPFGGA